MLHERDPLNTALRQRDEPAGIAARRQIQVASVVTVIGIWTTVCSLHLVNPMYLPHPGDVIGALWVSIRTGELAINVSVSLARITIALIIGSILGVALGSLSGAFPAVGAAILPLNSALRYIPPTAFIGLTILWLGIGTTSKIALIVLGIIFYIIQMTSDVVRLVPKVYAEAAVTMGATRGEVFANVILRHSIPDILAVLRVNLGAAWTFLVAAEVVAADQGIGYLISTSQRFLQTPKLFALLAVVGTLGFASDMILGIAIRRCARWRQTLA